MAIVLGLLPCKEQIHIRILNLNGQKDTACRAVSVKKRRMRGTYAFPKVAETSP